MTTKVGRAYLVTLVDRWREVTVEVAAASIADAKREARKLHPCGQIVAVEATRDDSCLTR